MGITQQSAAARLIQPGVIANASERPASPYEGQCIFQKDTDQLLVWNGTAWVIPNAPAQNPTGLELIKTQTIGTGVTSIPVSDAFSSIYDTYRIIIEIQDSNSNAQVTFSLDGISTSTYYTGGSFGSWGISGQSGYGPAAGTNWQLTANDATSVGSRIILDLTNPNIARRKYGNSNGQSGNGHATFNLYSTSTSTATAFTVAKGGNTMTGGSIAVYGYRK